MARWQSDDGGDYVDDMIMTVDDTCIGAATHDEYDVGVFSFMTYRLKGMQINHRWLE